MITPFELNIVNQPKIPKLHFPNSYYTVPKKSKDKALNEVRKTVKETIENEEYDWRIARVTDNGVITLEDK